MKLVFSTHQFKKLIARITMSPLDGTWRRALAMVEDAGCEEVILTEEEVAEILASSEEEPFE